MNDISNTINVVSRKCIAARSIRYPTQKCGLTACDGDLCNMHSKYGSILYVLPVNTLPINISLKINKLRIKLGLLRWKRQGFAAACTALASNDTEIYSLDTVSSIPRLYRFSINDNLKNIWLFDIRSLLRMWDESIGKTLINPYTRAEFSHKDMLRFHIRVAWIRNRKYSLYYSANPILTPRQQYQQKLNNTFANFDRAGYMIQSEWFEVLTTEQHRLFRQEIQALWLVRLNLSPITQRTILPTSNGNIFAFSTDSGDLIEMQNLDILWRLSTEAATIEDRTTGIMYGLMALCRVSTACYEQYGWLREQIPIDLPPTGDVLIRVANGLEPGAVQTFAVNGNAFNQYIAQYGPQLSFNGPGAMQLFSILPPAAIQFLFSNRPLPPEIIRQREEQERQGQQ